MLKWALIFFIASLIAGALGLTGLAGGLAFVAKVLFGIFLFVAVVLLVLGVTIFKAVT